MTQRSLFKSGCNSKGSFDNFQLQSAMFSKKNGPLKSTFDLSQYRYSKISQCVFDGAFYVLCTTKTLEIEPMQSNEW